MPRTPRSAGSRSPRSHRIRSAARVGAHGPHARRMRLEPLEDRRMLAALVGVDFGGGGVPPNWTQVSQVGTAGSPTVRSNLVDESGAATPIDLTISNSSGLIAIDQDAPINAETLPQHTQSLAGLNKIVFVDGPTQHSFSASFSDLNPASVYEIYVFALEDGTDGLIDSQTVTISGGGAPIVFQQNPISENNLWVNDQVGSSAQSLASYRKLQTPAAGGAISVTVQMNANSDSLVLAGLAIRAVGTFVNDAGDFDDNNAANGVTTLREAVRLANAWPGAETISFAANMSGATIDLYASEIAITEALTIDAAPLATNVTINARQQSRIFNITAPSGDFTLAGLTLTAGLARSSGGVASGGAVRSVTSGLLTVTECTVSENQALGFDWDAYGGGISALGSVMLTRSTVSGNAADASDFFFQPVNSGGGGLDVRGQLTLLMSTISGNSVRAIGRAEGGGILATSAVKVIDSTITGNRTEGSGGGFGGGIFQTESAMDFPISITGSIIAGNTAANLGPDLRPDLQSVAVPGAVAYSLIGNIADSGVTDLTGPGNLLNVPALLGPLTDNGGPTKTHALLPGSPALDAGSTPLAYYRFEETTGTTAADPTRPYAADFHNFTASTQSGPPAVGGNAALLDGVDDYLLADAPLNLVFVNQYSVELWFHATSVGGEQALVAVSDGDGGHVLLLEIEPDGSVRFLSRPNGGPSGGDNLYTPPGAVVAGQWYHLAAVRDGAKMRIFLNGAQVAALESASTGAPASSAYLTLGRLSELQNDRHFGGKLDEVVIHDRVLSAGEAALHASRGFVDQRGLLAVVDGDGSGAARPDMGAYEAQAEPTADFDADGDVDGGDFLAWQRGVGKTVDAERADGDSNHDGKVDHSDLAAWRTQFGATGLGVVASITPTGATPVTTSASAVSALAVSASAAPATGPSTLTLDAAFASTDLMSLFAGETVSRPQNRARWRRR